MQLQKGSLWFAIFASYFQPSLQWLPTRDSGMIRGVNLGGLFISEPWMMMSEWQNMGCANTKSEFDCVRLLGQSAADSAFQQHYATWITKDDIANISSYGLNTIRIPLGYWIFEDMVDRSSEYFPRGGLAYLMQICSWAQEYNLYIILDLHGAPFAQVPEQPFTGQYAPTAGFYTTLGYQRGYQFLYWLTNLIYADTAFANVGTIEILNEPLSWDNAQASLASTFYPNAWNIIRSVENALGKNLNPAAQLHIMFMDKNWGAGDPTSAVPNWFNAYDDHEYPKWSSSVQNGSPADYIRYTCGDSRANPGETPLIVGEWSLSVWNENSAPFDKNNNKQFYRDWFVAQVQQYENNQGWIFWSWKTTLDDYRWSYQKAVQAGVIPTNLNNTRYSAVCQQYRKKLVDDSEDMSFMNFYVPQSSNMSYRSKPLHDNSINFAGLSNGMNMSDIIHYL